MDWLGPAPAPRPQAGCKVVLLSSTGWAYLQPVPEAEDLVLQFPELGLCGVGRSQQIQDLLHRPLHSVPHIFLLLALLAPWHHGTVDGGILQQGQPLSSQVPPARLFYKHTPSRVSQAWQQAQGWGLLPGPLVYGSRGSHRHGQEPHI